MGAYWMGFFSGLGTTVLMLIVWAVLARGARADDISEAQLKNMQERLSKQRSGHE